MLLIAALVQTAPPTGSSVSEAWGTGSDVEPQRDPKDGTASVQSWEIVQTPWPASHPSAPLPGWATGQTAWEPPPPRTPVGARHPSGPLPAPPIVAPERTRRRTWLVSSALVALGLAVGGAGGAFTGASVADDQDRVDALTHEVSSRDDRIAGLEQDVVQTHAQAEEDIANARSEAEKQVAQENADKQAQLDARSAALDAREADVARREDAVKVLEEQAADGSLPGDGLWLVGSEVAPGTYRATEPADCYWARLSGTSGDFSELIANGLGAGAATVTIKASDKAFSSERCGSWQRIN